MKHISFIKRLIVVTTLFASLVSFIWAFLIVYSPTSTRFELRMAIVLLLVALAVCIFILLWAERMKTIYKAVWDGSIMELVNIEDDNDRLIAATNDFKHGECVKSDELVITRDSTIIEGLHVRLAYRKGVVTQN